MAFTANEQAIVDLYIAAYARAPEKSGLDYWANELESGNRDIANIRDYFLDTTNNPEAAARFSTDQTSTQQVEAVYQNVLGRASDAGGLEYWRSVLDSGEKTLQELIESVLASAKLPENAAIDGATLANKSAAAEYFLTTVPTELQAGNQPFLDTVTYDSTSFTNITASIDNILTDTTSNINASLGNLSTLDTYGVSTLSSGTYWDSSIKTITYSFNSSIPNDYYIYNQYTKTDELTNNWQELNTAQKDATRSVMDELNQLLGVKFEEVSSDGMIQLNMVQMDPNTAGFSFYPGDTYSYYGDVFLSTDFNDKPKEHGLDVGEFGRLTIVHELGHALGLKHPFEGTPTLPTTVDDINHTIMSYTSTNNYVPILSFSSTSIYIDYKKLEPSSYSLYDVAALQAIYGVNTTTNTQDNVYKISFLDYNIQTIWDAGGTDTIDLSDTTGFSTIDLRAGSLNSADQKSLSDIISIYQDIAAQNNKSQHDSWIADNITQLYNSDNLYTGINNLGIATGTVIENIYTGSGNDIITDNEVNNHISTAAGDDKIYLGNGGYDYIDGGDGNDTIYLELLSSDISLKSSDEGGYLLYADTFGAHLIDIENIHFSDSSVYALDLLIA